jgi:hypothetical protein
MGSDTEPIVREKVERYLQDLVGELEGGPDGPFSFRKGSARVFVVVQSLADRWTLVTIQVGVLFYVPASEVLYRHVALHAGDLLFGTLSLRPTERPGYVDVVLLHSLLGDYLDREELNVAVQAIATAADAMDNQLQDHFGGIRYHEDVA